MTKTEIRRYTSWLGKRGWKARIKKQGLERIREIARENGRKFGGRPRLPEYRLTRAGLRTRRYRDRRNAERAKARASKPDYKLGGRPPKKEKP